MNNVPSTRLHILGLADGHGLKLSAKLATRPHDLVILAGDMLCPGHSTLQYTWMKDVLMPWCSLFQVPVLCIGGNHDWAFYKGHVDLSPPCPFIYLQDSGYTYRKDNVRIPIWGTPWVPTFNNWAFNACEEELAQHFARIPQDTQVLITHVPPYGILDKTQDGTHIGSVALRERIMDLPNLCLHIFGHNHHTGQSSVTNPKRHSLRHVNVALRTEEYKLRNISGVSIEVTIPSHPASHIVEE